MKQVGVKTYANGQRRALFELTCQACGAVFVGQKGARGCSKDCATHLKTLAARKHLLSSERRAEAERDYESWLKRVADLDEALLPHKHQIKRAYIAERIFELERAEGLTPEPKFYPASQSPLTWNVAI